MKSLKLHIFLFAVIYNFVVSLIINQTQLIPIYLDLFLSIPVTTFILYVPYFYFTCPITNTFLYKSMASNELLAHVVSMKYQYAMPLYRMESYFKMMNVNLSRQTLSNWIISCANELQPIFDYMKEELLKRNYIHADETYVKVIEENGKDSNSKRFMWLYRSGGIENSIILYDYQNTRSGSCAEKFLEGFSGYLQTDYADIFIMPTFYILYWNNRHSKSFSL